MSAYETRKADIVYYSDEDEKLFLVFARCLYKWKH